MRLLKVSVMLVAVSLLALGLTACERKVTNETTIIISPGSAAIVGSDKCQPCHGDIHADFVNSGHPYKLNKAADAQQAGYYPYEELPSALNGFSWDQVAYVIGGFRWKARFIGLNGKIITLGADSKTQYNVATEDAPEAEWVSYHPGEDKDYNCGPCHMTAYSPEGNQDGLPGMIGTWALDGIQCEECHGGGELHVASPRDNGMLIARSNEACGKCHIRGSVTSIPASGGFIRHHEQWNEMFASKHASLDCVDCHDPHKGLHEDNPDRAAAIKSKCESCHFKEATAYADAGLPHEGLGINCLECHMPKAAKSARKVGDFKGDVRSHLFGINTDPDAPMFSEDGKSAMGYLTLDYVCIQCHTTKDKTWAADYTALIHPTGSEEELTTCFSCHSDNNSDFVAAQQEWANSVHASGDNIDRNRNNRSSYSSCEPCHTHEGFVADVSGNPASGEHFTVISCFTCHEPHTTGGLGLRVEGEYTLRDGTTFDYGKGNLCVRCHHSRQDVREYVADSVTLSGHWGPHHSDQGDVLVGSGGYEYSGYSYDVSAHTGVLKEGCIDCHMTGSFANKLGGHTWKVYDEELNKQLLIGCNVDDCHGKTGPLTSFDRTASADFDGDGTIEGVQTEVSGLLNKLAEALVTAGLMAGDAEDGYHPVSGRIVLDADSSGAVYNYEVISEERSLGVHNTQYAVGLLTSAYNFITTGSPNGVAPKRTPDELVRAH